MQDGRKAVWIIPYVSVAFFPSLNLDFIAYRSSKVSYCIFEIHQLWQSGFSRLYSNCCCSCSFEPEIIKISQSSQKMYNNTILNFQVSAANLNVCTKKVWKLIEGLTYDKLNTIYLSVDVHVYIYIVQHRLFRWITTLQYVDKCIKTHIYEYMYIYIDLDPRLRPWKENTEHGLEVRKIY